jgi:hypothetical protein
LSAHEGVAAGGVIEGVLDLGLAAGDFAIDGGLDGGVGVRRRGGFDVGHFTLLLAGAAGGGEGEGSAEGEDGDDGKAAGHYGYDILFGGNCLSTKYQNGTLG